jgi:hypothetical protein
MEGQRREGRKKEGKQGRKEGEKEREKEQSDLQQASIALQSFMAYYILHHRAAGQFGLSLGGLSLRSAAQSHLL